MESRQNWKMAIYRRSFAQKPKFSSTAKFRGIRQTISSSDWQTFDVARKCTKLEKNVDAVFLQTYVKLCDSGTRIWFPNIVRERRTYFEY